MVAKVRCPSNPATYDEYSESGSDTEDDIEESCLSESSDDVADDSATLRLRIKSSLAADIEGDSHLD